METPLIYRDPLPMLNAVAICVGGSVMAHGQDLMIHHLSDPLAILAASAFLDSTPSAGFHP